MKAMSSAMEFIDYLMAHTIQVFSLKESTMAMVNGHHPTSLRPMKDHGSRVRKRAVVHMQRKASLTKVIGQIMNVMAMASLPLRMGRGCTTGSGIMGSCTAEVK